MLNKEEQIDLIVLIATFKSFNEQLYNMKGKHKAQTKMWFNRLLNTARSYENSIKSQTDLIDDENFALFLNKINYSVDQKRYHEM